MSGILDSVSLIGEALLEIPTLKERGKMSLSKVLKEMNTIRNLTLKKHHTISMRTMTIEEGIEVFDHINSQLSPEWLTMDGERSFKQSKAREQMLITAFIDLRKHGHIPSKEKMYNIPNNLLTSGIVGI